MAATRKRSRISDTQIVQDSRHASASPRSSRLGVCYGAMSPPPNSQSSQDANGLATIGECAACGAPVGEFYNAWRQITGNYYLPLLLGSYSSRLREGGRASAARPGTAVNGCTIRPLECPHCSTSLGFLVVSAPPDRDEFRDRDFFKLSRIQLKCEVAGRLVPVKPRLDPVPDNPPNEDMSLLPAMEGEAAPPQPGHPPPQHQVRRAEPSHRQSPAPNVAPAPPASHAPVQKPVLNTQSPPVHNIQAPPVQHPVHHQHSSTSFAPPPPSREANTQLASRPRDFPTPPVVPSSPATPHHANGGFYPPVADVKFESMSRIQAQVSQNSATLSNQQQQFQRLEEGMRQQFEALENGMRGHLEAQANYHRAEIKRVDDAIRGIHETMSNIVRDMNSRIQPTSTQDSALEVMANTIKEVRDKASEIEHLRMTTEILQGRVSRMEGVSAPPPVNSNTFPSPREPSSSSTHQTPHHTPHILPSNVPNSVASSHRMHSSSTEPSSVSNQMQNSMQSLPSFQHSSHGPSSVPLLSTPVHPHHQGQQGQRHSISYHQTPSHQTPTHHQNTSQHTPAHQLPSHQTPAHQTPAHQTPAHQTPAHQTPAHQTPVHQTPAHQTPAHQILPSHSTPINSQQAEAEKQQSGWVSVNSNMKRTHPNGLEGPHDLVGHPIGSPKRSKLAPIEPRMVYEPNQTPQQQIKYDPMDTSDSDSRGQQSLPQSHPQSQSQSQPQSRNSLSELSMVSSTFIPYNSTQDAPSDSSWRPESQRTPIEPHRSGRGGRGRGGGPGSRGGRPRKSYPTEVELGTPEWEKDSWVGPDAEISPNRFYMPGEQKHGRENIVRRGSGGGGNASAARIPRPTSSSGRSVSMGMQGVTPGPGINLVGQDPYSHTKKTRTKPIRNADGILIRKDGRPDMRSQSSAANLRKVHARKEEQKATGREYTPTSGLYHSTGVGEDTPSPMEGGEDAGPSTQQKHQAIMRRMFPEGLDEARRGHDYAKHIFDSVALANAGAATARGQKIKLTIERESRLASSDVSSATSTRTGTGTGVDGDGDVEMRATGTETRSSSQGEHVKGGEQEKAPEAQSKAQTPQQAPPPATAPQPQGQLHITTTARRRGNTLENAVRSSPRKAADREEFAKDGGKENEPMSTRRRRGTTQDRGFLSDQDKGRG